MGMYFKSALDQIKAEPELVEKTETALWEIIKKEQNSRRKKNIFGKRAAIACMILFLFCSGYGTYVYYKIPTAYVDMDINPSVELAVNTFGKVIGSTAYNREGIQILEGANLQGKSIGAAAETVVLSAIDFGFIAKDGSSIILMTIECKNSTEYAKIERNVAIGMERALKNREKAASIQRQQADLKLRAAASSYGMTAGKFMLINRLRAIEPGITIEQFKEASIAEIMKRINLQGESERSNKLNQENNRYLNMEQPVTDSREAGNEEVTMDQKDAIADISNSNISENNENSENALVISPTEPDKKEVALPIQQTGEEKTGEEKTGELGNGLTEAETGTNGTVECSENSMNDTGNPTILGDGNEDSSSGSDAEAGSGSSGSDAETGSSSSGNNAETGSGSSGNNAETVSSSSGNNAEAGSSSSGNNAETGGGSSGNDAEAGSGSSGNDAEAGSGISGNDAETVSSSSGNNAETGSGISGNDAEAGSGSSGNNAETGSGTSNGISNEK